VKLAELAATGRTPPAPCDVGLVTSTTSTTLHIEDWLRVLPGSRYVARARWCNRPVLAKLLLGRKAAQHYRAELTGAKLLAAQQLPTPALCASGLSTGQGAWLFFEWLHDAPSLHQQWQQLAGEPLLSSAQHLLLTRALSVIAALHRCGLWQADLHLDNLLRQGETIYLIDAAGVRVPLSRRRTIANLALFFAQFSPQLDAYMQDLLAFYVRANPAHMLAPTALLAAIAHQRRRRIRRYLKKTTRDCSAFCRLAGEVGGSADLRIVRRDQATLLLPLLAPGYRELDAQIAAGHIYKTGGSASVARIDWHGRALVLKRYNVKNFRHWLRRCWRPSRAVHSWRQAHRLELLDIATPRPLAVIEVRCWSLRQRAYLITEYCPGPSLLAYLSEYLERPPPEAALTALVQLFSALIRARVSHGDLKGHNLIWHTERWWLIDLDAMREHRSPRSFARAYARDRARLLRNFPPTCSLYRVLDARLPRL